MKALQRVKVGIIGAGNMGQALIKGLCAAGVPPKRITAVEANAATRRHVKRQHHVTSAHLERVATNCDVVIVAVKPQDIRPVLDDLGRRLKERGRRALVISVAAGVKIAAIERMLGRMPVVRVMPNLAAKVGCSISAVAFGRWIAPGQRGIAKAIFQCVGEVVELPERLFDVVTAISGSGPAYFFLIFKALRDAGIREGLSTSVAERLVLQTALGSAQLVNGSREDLETLIAQVASKKGTTEAALKVFRRRGLARAIQAAVSAATRRSTQLAERLEQEVLKQA